MLRGRRRAPDVAAGAPCLRREASRLRQPGPAKREWRLLRGGLPYARPLSWLDHAAERLAERTPRQVDDASAIWAAVALVLAPDPDALLLIRRAERIGDPWSGHVGLPGGRRASDDPDLLATAIRETAEEVGLTLEPRRRIGTLDDVSPRTPTLPPLTIRPYVFRLDHRVALTLNGEVAAAGWVELDRLRRIESRRDVEVAIHGSTSTVPAFVLDDLVVWGLTHRILDLFISATE
jgi:8-oxo-dGTP pyrophosphatase MutT (NUDIX family)